MTFVSFITQIVIVTENINIYHINIIVKAQSFDQSYLVNGLRAHNTET